MSEVITSRSIVEQADAVQVSIRMTRQVHRGSRSAITWAQVALFLTALSCIKFLSQDGLSTTFDYTQALIQTGALSLGSVAALRALSRSRDNVVFRRVDLLLAAFVLSTFIWSWRSWNPGLSVGYALCYLTLLINVKIAVSVLGARTAFTSLYLDTLLFVAAGVLASYIWPAQYSIFVTIGTDIARSRFALFSMHPILVADILAVNLIGGLFVAPRFRYIGHIIFGIGMLATASRASIACGVIVTIVAALYAAQHSGRWRLALQATAVLLAATLLVWTVTDPQSLIRLLFPTADSATLMGTSLEDRGLNGRLPLWGKIIDTLSADNLEGFGFSGYRRNLFELSGWALHAHNSVLDAILASGYLGGGCLIAYYLLACFRKRTPSDTIPLAMRNCMILYVVAVGMMGPSLLEPYLTMYLLTASFRDARGADAQSLGRARS